MVDIPSIVTQIVLLKTRGEITNLQTCVDLRGIQNIRRVDVQSNIIFYVLTRNAACFRARKDIIKKKCVSSYMVKISRLTFFVLPKNRNCLITPKQ